MIIILTNGSNNRNENGIVKKVMTVYCVQEPPGTEKGMPRINVNKALHFGNIEFLFSERAQLVYSSGALVRELRKKLEKFNDFIHLKKINFNYIYLVNKLSFFDVQFLVSKSNLISLKLGLLTLPSIIIFSIL